MKSAGKGFTLVEMLVVMCIMVILFGIGAPLLLQIASYNVVESSARQMESVMIMARSLAAKHGTNYSVVFSYWGYSGTVSWTTSPSVTYTAETKYSDGLVGEYYIISNKLDGNFPSHPESSAGKWSYKTLYSTGAKIRGTDGKLYKATTGGTSTTSKMPSWNGGTVNEASNTDSSHPNSAAGTVSWECVDEGLGSVDSYQVGPKYSVESGAQVKRMTYNDGSGNSWYSNSYSLGDPIWPKATAKYRITFTPTGEAIFVAPFSSPEDDEGWQCIVVAKDDVSGTMLELRQGTYLHVMVNKYSGDIKIMKRSD